MHFKRGTSFELTTLKKKTGIERIHLEHARGTDEEDKKCCEKEGDVAFEHGEP